MGKVRKQLLDEIDERIARKKKLRAEVAKRKDDIDAYVLKLMEDVDEVMAKVADTNFALLIVPFYIQSLESHIQSIDSGAKVEVSWQEAEGVNSRLNGILIKWSPEYQVANKCDPERYIDIASILFK